jgi:ABC-type transport system involved in multi-copper enzyme maturation permease subunit
MLRLLGLFLGPMFAKEMVEMSRRKRYYFNRILYGCVLLLTLFIVWEEYRWRLGQGGRASIRAQAQMAEHFFNAVICIQFSAVFLFVPLFLCGVVSSEREEHTLDLILTTQLSDREIVLGKLTSRMAALVFLILSGLPVLSLIMFFGGIDPVCLALTTLATLAALLFTSAHAIYFSTITKSPTGALVRTYWWLLVELIILPYAICLPIAAFVHEFARPIRDTVLAWMSGVLLFTNPIGPFVVALNPYLYNEIESYASGIVGDDLAEWFFPSLLLLPALWSLFLLRRSAGVWCVSWVDAWRSRTAVCKRRCLDRRRAWSVKGRKGELRKRSAGVGWAIRCGSGPARCVSTTARTTSAGFSGPAGRWWASSSPWSPCSSRAS